MRTTSAFLRALSVAGLVAWAAFATAGGADSASGASTSFAAANDIIWHGPEA
ncbi:hypothetical protein ACFWUQ_00380 [Streptomyces sp. NPDC058662]|uniref:hypothetical protein n=1 Tax=Streptomyces sp. NPDC058662 TaxID=3346583 RepID=UPI003656383B